MTLIKNLETRKFCEDTAQILRQFGQAQALKAVNEFIEKHPQIAHWEVLAIKAEIVRLAK